MNPNLECRQGWDAVAVYDACHLMWVHVTCRDASQHRERIDVRRAEGVKRGADWSEINSRSFEAPPLDWLVIDTATPYADDAASLLMRSVQSGEGRP
ncbi:MAG: hypothetical protein HKP37_06085 [Boseongicola sp.]|nr:hypothetical protein [Boseongicola sp.]